MAEQSPVKKASTGKKVGIGCLSVIGFFIFLGVIASFNSDKDKEVSPPETRPAESITVETKPKLELLGAKTVNEQYARYIAGSIKNNTKKEYSYVQVSFNLYDSSGAQVGSTFANTNNLEPGGTWKFKAIIMEDNARSFKFKEVTGF